MEYSAILLTLIKLPFVIKIFVLSIFEWLYYTDFTVRTEFYICDLINYRIYTWAVTLDFQQCGMSNQQSLRPACAYAQSNQSLCQSLEYLISV